LAAGIAFAREGRDVLILEAKDTLGGGMRTKQLTLPGFRHDVCSAVHPLALASPFFRSLDLGLHGLEWIQPPTSLAHPLEDGTAIALDRSIETTASRLGDDGEAYLRLIGPLVKSWKPLIEDLLKPLGPPRSPIVSLRFALRGMRSAVGLARSAFRGAAARALFAGASAHSIQPLEKYSTAAFGLTLLTLAHAVGWPIAKGGSQAIADALASLFVSLGGTIRLNSPIDSFDDIPASRVVLFTNTPSRVAEIVGNRFPESYLKRLERRRYGAGAFKIDWALDGPIPWAAEPCRTAGTVHLGGTLEEIAEAERLVGEGRIPDQPFVLLVQPSLFDAERAPAGKHTAWAYCHVPNGSTAEMTDRIETQIERFAPGFRSVILARSVMTPKDMERYNPNYIGGDIVGGPQTFHDVFLRPLGRFRAYGTPLSNVYLCGSSMPPGGGVHGMCGYLAAKRALRLRLPGFDRG
jgi:phytoene dehydrogenase-like protein